MGDADDDLLADSIEQLLASCATPQAVRAIEDGASADDLWQAIEVSGYCDALVGEAQGGAGLGLSDVFPILEACGGHALPLPLAQTIAARALLAQAGREPPAGPIALASTPPDGDGAIAVGYGAVARWVLLGDGSMLVLLDARDAQVERVEAGSVDARLRWPAAAFARTALQVESPVELRCVEACLLAAQLSGAMRRVLAVTLRHADERSRSGRPIGRFQAVQEQLSVMGGHVETARMAARMACATHAVVADPLLCALAKARASEAAVRVAGIAHAVHGAIGITDEYDLRLLTRRLHAWRTAAGSESYWNLRIGWALLDSAHASVSDFVRRELSVRPEPLIRA
jgi:acyl-CoA dehydrogenase